MPFSNSRIIFVGLEHCKQSQKWTSSYANTKKKQQQTTRAWEVGKCGGEQLPLSLMNALKKMSLPTYKLDHEFENIQRKKIQKNTNDIMSSVLGWIQQKIKKKQSKQETFTIAEEALLWKSFFQQMQSLPTRRINLKLFQCPFQ